MSHNQKTLVSHRTIIVGSLFIDPTVGRSPLRQRLVVVVAAAAAPVVAVAAAAAVLGHPGLAQARDEIAPTEKKEN